MTGISRKWAERRQNAVEQALPRIREIAAHGTLKGRYATVQARVIAVLAECGLPKTYHYQESARLIRRVRAEAQQPSGTWE